MDPTKDRLIELIRNAPKIEFPSGSRAQGKTYQTAANIADYLIANGVVIIDPQKYPPVTNRGIIDTIMGVPLDEMAALIAEKEKGYRKQSEVIEEYRKKVYIKMEKYTVFGREYIQRIMREAEKEMKGGAE